MRKVSEADVVSQLARNTWCVQSVALPLRVPDFYESVAKLAVLMPVQLSRVKNRAVLVTTWNAGARWVN